MDNLAEATGLARGSIAYPLRKLEVTGKITWIRGTRTATGSLSLGRPPAQVDLPPGNRPASHNQVLRLILNNADSMGLWEGVNAITVGEGASLAYSIARAALIGLEEEGLIEYVRKPGESTGFIRLLNRSGEVKETAKMTSEPEAPEVIARPTEPPQRSTQARVLGLIREKTGDNGLWTNVSAAAIADALSLITASARATLVALEEAGFIDYVRAPGEETGFIRLLERSGEAAAEMETPETEVPAVPAPDIPVVELDEFERLVMAAIRIKVNQVGVWRKFSIPTLTHATGLRLGQVVPILSRLEEAGLIIRSTWPDGPCIRVVQQTQAQSDTAS
jgi:DNA-binding MarR family transcriptional regulator